jgi:hypothetical protein
MVASGRGRVKDKGKEEWIWLIYFLHMYKHGTLKPVVTILWKGRVKRENNGEDEPNWVYVEMSQQSPTLQLLYSNKDI